MLTNKKMLKLLNKCHAFAIKHTCGKFKVSVEYDTGSCIKLVLLEGNEISNLTHFTGYSSGGMYYVHLSDYHPYEFEEALEHLMATIHNYIRDNLDELPSSR